MLINRSNKYNAKREFWHEGRQIHIQRAWGGVAFHGQPKVAIVVGEEDFFTQTNYYILAEGYTQPEAGEGLTELISLMQRIEAAYNVKRWFGRLDANVNEVLEICNKMSWKQGLRTITVSDVPRVKEWIDEQIALIHTVTKKENKRLFFFGESMVVGELQQVPKMDVRADEYPRTTALGNVIASMLKYTQDNYSPEDLMPPVEEIY